MSRAKVSDAARESKAATIGDVAGLAGVSIATVSRVLNGIPSVDHQLAERVRAACAALHFQPNRAARALAGHPSKIIGLLVTDIQTPFFMEVARGVEDVALQNGYLVVLCNMGEDPRKERRYAEALCAEDVAGVIATPSCDPEPCLQMFQRRGIPVVAIDRRPKVDNIDAVLIDNVSAAREAVSHLIANGYRRIGIVTGLHTTTTGRDRLDGYRDALREARIPRDSHLERRGLPSQDLARRMVAELLDGVPDLEALFTGNSRITLGALEEIQSRGLSVPADIAIVGFDDVSWASPVGSSITSVVQPAYEIGSTAAARLVQRIQHPTAATRQEIILTHRLAVRESSRPRADVVGKAPQLAALS